MTANSIEESEALALDFNKLANGAEKSKWSSSFMLRLAAGWRRAGRL